jgi:RNA polymerase sigma-B factor
MTGPSDHQELFRLLADLPADDPRRAQARERLVELYLPLVHSLARRYRGRGEPYEDLAQVGALGLIKAVDRFEVGRGLAFTTFAVPTVLGEIRRHFRDRTWALRVPRPQQELALRCSAATAELTQELGAAPTVEQLAVRVGVSEDGVLQALDCLRCYTTRSLDAPLADGDMVLADSIGGEDPALAGVEWHESLGPAVEQLPAREQTILRLRFYGNQTQSQIAQELGISQMHVSRLLASALADLREVLSEPAAPARV